MPFKSQLEIFVERYVFNVSKFNQIRTKKNFILKALYMIDAQFGIPCCDDPLATVSYTRENDILTNFLRNYFNESFNIRKNTNSLNRVKVLLSKALGRYIIDYPYANKDVDDNIIDSCCLVNFRFDSLTGDAISDVANFTLSLIDADNGNIVIPAVSWVDNSNYQIPKGNYYLQFVRGIIYIGAFTTMQIFTREEATQYLSNQFNYPIYPLNTLGSQNSAIFSIRNDVFAQYELSNDPV